MNLLIAPIDKDGTRKVGIKVIGVNSKFIKIFKTFEFNEVKFDPRPFSYFFHFCGELRAQLNGTEYEHIELTDGWDVQDKNIYIDYSHNPARLVYEDKDGLPTELSSGKKILTYKKTDGIAKYTVIKEVSRDSSYLECIVIKDGKEVFRKFKIENIIHEIEE